MSIKYWSLYGLKSNQRSLIKAFIKLPDELKITKTMELNLQFQFDMHNYYDPTVI